MGGVAAPAEREAAALHREALHVGWEREATMLRFTRRPPDAMDVATGAWGRVVEMAERTLAERGVPPTEATR